MTSAKDLLHSKKSAGVITVMPDCSVQDACRLMRDRRIGALVVAEDGQLRGMFTERDVVNRVVASRFGRAFEALRDSPIASDCMGVSVYRHKVMAFVSLPNA